jgi:peptide deformylase
MNDILKIDTGLGIVEEPINRLPLYEGDYPLLDDEVPEYKGSLPNSNMTTLIKRLQLTRKLYGGIGLSANQCGVYERVFVIGTDDFQMACINPKVISVSDDVVKIDEGCLSYPGLYLKIARPESVVVEYTDENGELQQTTLKGITARCFVHELEHMNGKRFTDNVGPVSLQVAKRKQQKIVKKAIRNHKKTGNGIQL